MLWLISCNESSGLNIHLSVTSEVLNYRQNMSISNFAPGKRWKRPSEISKGSQEMQSPVMCQVLPAY